MSYDPCHVTNCTGIGIERDDRGRWLCIEHASKRPLSHERGEAIGANDLCPCGSMKKFKKCCRPGLRKLGVY